MDYWVSSKKVQTGPYSLDQLQLLWQQGQLTSDSYYYDRLRSEWLPLKTLLEGKRKLFTPEEAFVRLGQNRLKGCLAIFNPDEHLQVYVEDGFVIAALGKTDSGEFALARALRLENASYEWLADQSPPAPNLRLNIAEYALKHAIASDVRTGAPPKVKRHTIALTKNILDKVNLKQRPAYILVADEVPTLKIKLEKMTNLVGRDDHCDVIIDNSQVSRKHCLLEVWEDNVKVKDLDSSNGTFVNGVPVKDGFLRSGDQLRLGQYRLLLHKELKKAPDMPR
jgi:hypothetical protein